MARKPVSETARARFARLLAEHLKGGTRPKSVEGEPWTYAAFGSHIPGSRANETVSERTVSNWCKGKTLPAAIDPILRSLFGRTPEGNHHVHARGELRDAFIAARAEKFAVALAQAEPDPAGGEWVIQNEQFTLDRTARATDNTAAADPLRQNLQNIIRKFSAELIEPAKRLSNSRTWNALPRAIADFHALLDCDPLIMPERLSEAYALLLRLGRFLETDVRVQDDPTQLDDPLDPDIHGLLVDVVRTASPWMRGFPTVALLDDEAGKALVRVNLFKPAREFTQIAHGQHVISERDAAEMELLADTADAIDFQGQKAGARAVGHAKNLLLAGAEIIAASRANVLETQSRTQRLLVRRAIETLTAAEAQVEAFSTVLPPDLQQALRFLIKNGENSENNDAEDLLSTKLDIPDDLEERAVELIIEGKTPPIGWRPLIDRLIFPPGSVINIDALSSLTALEHLELRSNEVSDLSPLSNLTKMKYLDLGNTAVTDVSPLVKLKALQRLELWGTEIDNISTLSNLTNLKHLELGTTDVSDLSPLANLTGLERLELWGTSINDIDYLAKLTALKHLDLEQTPVSDVSALSGLTALEFLDLQDTHVRDLSPLAGLRSLERLKLTGTAVDDISPLSGLHKLTYLDINRTQVSNVAPLADMISLFSLNLGDTPIKDISHIANIPDLNILDLDQTEIRDLSGLSSVLSLRRLNLDGTQVSNLAPLSVLTNLEYLELGGTAIYDVSPLAGLNKLTYLDLTASQVKNVSPLSGLSSLKQLNLTKTLVTDVSPLASLTNLQELYIQNTSISDFSALDGLECKILTDLGDETIEDIF